MTAQGECIFTLPGLQQNFTGLTKKNKKNQNPTHLILVLLCKCPPKNVPSNTLLSGFFFPRLLQISLPLCAQQRSENPLWQQGKKRQEKKKKKGKDLTTWRTFLEKKSFS